MAQTQWRLPSSTVTIESEDGLALSGVLCCGTEEPICGKQEVSLSCEGVQNVAGEKHVSDSGSPGTPASPGRQDSSSLSTSAGFGYVEGSPVHQVTVSSPSAASVITTEHCFPFGPPGPSWAGACTSTLSRCQNPLGSPLSSSTVAVFPDYMETSHEQFADITTNDIRLFRDPSVYGEAIENSTKRRDTSGRVSSPLARSHVLSSHRNFGCRGKHSSNVPAGVPVSRHFDPTRPTPFELSKFDRRDPYQLFYLPVDCPYGRRCSDGDCPLAHTKLEKIFHPIVYKTQVCQMALEGRCEYLQKCAFFHTEEDKQEAEGQWKRWELLWNMWRHHVDYVLLKHKRLEKEIRRKVDGIMRIRMPRLGLPVCGVRGGGLLMATDDLRTRHASTAWNCPVSYPIARDPQCGTPWYNNNQRPFHGAVNGRMTNRNRLIAGGIPFREVAAPKFHSSLNGRPILMLSGDASADIYVDRIEEMEYPRNSEPQHSGLGDSYAFSWGDGTYDGSASTVEYHGDFPHCQGVVGDTRTVCNEGHEVVDFSTRDQAAQSVAVKLEGMDVRHPCSEEEQRGVSVGCGGFHDRTAEAFEEFRDRGTVVTPQGVIDRMHWMWSRSNSKELSQRQLVSPEKCSGAGIRNDARPLMTLGLQGSADGWDSNGVTNGLSDIGNGGTLHLPKWQDGEGPQQYEQNYSTDAHPPVVLSLPDETVAAQPLYVKRLDECADDPGMYCENSVAWQCNTRNQVVNERFEARCPGYGGRVVVCTSNQKCPSKFSNTRIEYDVKDMRRHFIEHQGATIECLEDASNYMRESRGEKSIGWSEAPERGVASEGMWEDGFPFRADTAEMGESNMQSHVEYRNSTGDCGCQSSTCVTLMNRSRPSCGREIGMCRQLCRCIKGACSQGVVNGGVAEPNSEDRLRAIYKSTSAAALDPSSSGEVVLRTEGMKPFSHIRDLPVLPSARCSLESTVGDSCSGDRQGFERTSGVPIYTDESLEECALRIPGQAHASESAS